MRTSGTIEWAYLRDPPNTKSLNTITIYNLTKRAQNTLTRHARKRGGGYISQPRHGRSSQPIGLSRRSANIAWALETASQRAAAEMAFAAQEWRLGDFNTQALANTAWAFATIVSN